MASLEAPFAGSPRVVSETDTSDSETEDILTDDIGVSESSRALPSSPTTSHGDRISIPNNTVKRTNLKNPSCEKTPVQSPPTSVVSVNKENPRKRRCSELFTSGKENIPF